MAYKKKLATPRRCAQCNDPYEAVDRRRLYCCPACKTAASQARRSATTVRRPGRPPATTSTSLTTPPAALPLAAPVVASGPGNPSFGKLTLATMAGNLLTDAAKEMWAPKETTGSAPTSGWPTWPPAELLAATGPAVQLTHASWPGPQLLTPTTYRRHQFYLALEQGRTVVLHQTTAGTWHYVETPLELAQLVARPPVSPGMKALLARYGGTAQAQAALSAPVVAATVAAADEEAAAGDISAGGTDRF